MLTEDKIKQLKKRIKRGEPEGELKEQLRKEGFSKEDIDQIFVPHRYDMRSWYLLFGIIISLAGLYIFITGGGLLLLILGGLLFIAYTTEISRLKKH